MNYEKLMAKALKDFDSFSLVWRDGFEFNEHCALIERSLSSFLIEEQRTDEWPGTKIFGALATVRHYKVQNESIEIIGEAGSFKAWMVPSYPEDLAFYKSKNIVYTSIAHENEEWESE
jgi:hypothetical protein